MAVLGQQRILVTRVHPGHEIQRPLHKLHEDRLFVNDERHRDRIDIGESVACGVFLEIVGVLAHHEFHALLPQLHLERAGADGVLPEVLAVTLHDLMRHHRAVFHRQDAEKRRKRLREFDLEHRVVQRFECGIALFVALHLLEDPRAGRGHFRTENATEAIDKILRRDVARFPEGEELRLVELYIVAEDERVGFPVLRDCPAFGDGRHHAQLVVHIHQTVV